jgi:hypothetical protein
VRRSLLLLALWAAALCAACSDDSPSMGGDTALDPDSEGDAADVAGDPDATDALEVAEPDADAAELGEDHDVPEDPADADEADAEDGAEDMPPDFPPGPPRLLLTISELPAAMNGSLPYSDRGGPPTEFTVAVPTFGFTLDLMADRPPAGLDAETVELSCDAAFGPNEELAAGESLAEQLVWEPHRVRWLVPEALRLAEGRVSCEARVANLEGELSEWSRVTFDAVTMTPERHPFDVIDPWVITFTRDRYDIRLSIQGSNYNVVAEPVEGGDGEADFDEDLRLVGFAGDESGAGAATLEARGVVGVNAVMRAWIIDEVMRQVRGHYGVNAATGAPDDEDAVRILLYLEGDPGAPDPSAFDGSFSIHGVGGDAPPEASNLFGRASAVDIYNLTAQDDGRLGYGSFTTNVFRLVLGQAAGRFLLRDFLPGDGVPLGELDIDAAILADGFDPRAATTSTAERVRYNQLVFALGLLTKALSSLISHEIGHSVGLVACGAPPYGLFSGIYDPSFMDSDPGCGHLDTPGLNVMQTGASLLENPADLAGEVRFAPISLAYLRGRLVLVR